MTMFAGCVTMPKTAMVVKAVLVSRLRPLLSAVIVNKMRVMAGVNMPSAFALIFSQSCGGWWTSNENLEKQRTVRTAGVVVNRHPSESSRDLQFLFSELLYSPSEVLL